MSTREVIIATIGRAHGLRGEVGLVLRTDQPGERLVPGTVFVAGTPSGERTLTVGAVRTQQDRWYVRFREVADRTDAESLRGVELPLELDEQVEIPPGRYPLPPRGALPIVGRAHRLRGEVGRVLLADPPGGLFDALDEDETDGEQG